MELESSMLETEAAYTTIDVWQAARLVERIVREGVDLLRLDKDTGDMKRKHSWTNMPGGSKSKVYRASVPLAGGDGSVLLSADGFLALRVGNHWGTEDCLMESGIAFLCGAESDEEPTAFLFPDNMQAMPFLESLNRVLNESGIELFMGTFSAKACASQPNLLQKPIFIEAELEHMRETMPPTDAGIWGVAN